MEKMEGISQPEAYSYLLRMKIVLILEVIFEHALFLKLVVNVSWILYSMDP